jgi:predicted nucleic acid-binding protein
MSGDPLPDYLMESRSLFKAFFIHSELKLGVLRNSSVSELTIFEVGNALWKKRDENLTNMSGSELFPVVQRIESVTGFLTRSTISSNELTSIFRLPPETGLNFYDTSSLHLARSVGKKLTTEDKKMSEASTEMGVRLPSKDQIL